MVWKEEQTNTLSVNSNGVYVFINIEVLFFFRFFLLWMEIFLQNVQNNILYNYNDMNVTLQVLFKWCEKEERNNTMCVNSNL